MARMSVDDDPLAHAIRPPDDEPADVRIARERGEARAREVSRRIDEQLHAERAAYKKLKNAVKVLILGQSESGKSATLKNFQLKFNRKAFVEERAAWRTVIHLNLVRSVTLILDLLTEELSDPAIYPELDDDLPSPLDYSDASFTFTSRATPPLDGNAPIVLTEHHKLLCLRLGPLHRVQRDLEARLGSAASEIDDGDYSTMSHGSVDQSRPSKPSEFYVRSTTGWKGVLKKAISHVDGSAKTGRRNREPRDDVTDVIVGCRNDIQDLWGDEMVHRVLHKRDIRLQESPGFFLDDVERIANPDYEPSDSDVVRARLRTLGVQEYHFRLGGDNDFIMYDVAGARGARAAWFPYFEDVNAIIFLAPISCFDEHLAEDYRVNRLKDSLLLWQSVCSSKILANVQLILFLNKCDLLEAKLQNGIQIATYIPSYKDRSNDFRTAASYFKNHFKDILVNDSPVPRDFLAHFTSAIDTKSTSLTVAAVHEGILRYNLKSSTFL